MGHENHISYSQDELEVDSDGQTLTELFSKDKGLTYK